MYHNLRETFGRGHEYTSLTSSDDDSSVKQSSQPNPKTKTFVRWTQWTLSGLLAFLLILGSLAEISGGSNDIQTRLGGCNMPPVRREWRSLTHEERTDFTQAVNCLATIPSRWRSNGTVYNDFTLLHGGIGSWCHRSASFLPWHRYTLFVWEVSLREYCGFAGHIPYWDWSLDWKDLANSSIWDNLTGFGGDGDPNGPVSVGEGRCVNDGPFSQLRPKIYNHTWIDHCLSRGFRDNTTSGRLPSQPFSPESIGKIVRNPNYKDFVKEIEYHLHNVMHKSIAGDFLALTAANDPIFFVHHVQLDHLWWQWQQENRAKRLQEYEGKHMFNSTGEASINDMLLYGGFVDDIPVSKVMDTENGFLCYRY